MLSKEEQDIIEKSLWVVNTALKKQGLQENEDLRQSAILYMCKCLERFDPTKNIKWTTFAYKNIYLYIKREHNKEAAKQALLISTELFYFIKRIDEDELCDRYAKKQRICHLKDTFTEDEIKILRLKQKGYKWAEMKEILQCSMSKITKTIKSINEKIKEIEKNN